MSVDVLVVGSGGREHALAWKLKQSPRIGKLYVAPGNVGTSGIAVNVPILEKDIEALARFADEKRIGLTIVGSEVPLELGIVDLFHGRGLRIFGPLKAAAQIETSKSFAKQLMHDQQIPTAAFQVFNSSAAAIAHVRLGKFPVVLKASGLAQGKGVYICKDAQEAKRALGAIEGQGEAGKEIIVEEFLEGPEFSVHVVTDGFGHITFPAAQDHKRALDNDLGDNTGGMGAIAPVPWITPSVMDTVQRTIVQPALSGIMGRAATFEGLLYPGLISTTQGPKTLEFNARFGDPETQTYMRLLSSDLLDILEACVDRKLSLTPPPVRWIRGFAVTVVLASGGYPGEYKTDIPITGINEAAAMPDIVIFHAGTKYDESYKTAGGRVLGVSATGVSPKEAIDKAYAAISKIHFDGMQYRNDIGAKVASYWSSVRV